MSSLSPVVSFRFTSSAPPSSFFSTVAALNNFDEQQFTQLLAIVSDTLFARADAAEQGIADFMAAHSVKSKPLRATVSCLQAVLGGAVKKNIPIQQIAEDLAKLGLDEGKCTIFQSHWSVSYSSLSAAAVLATFATNELHDIQWKFGVTASSSELKHIGSTFLQLKFTINTSDGLECRCVELSLKQFYVFLNQMQNAKRQIEAMSGK